MQKNDLVSVIIPAYNAGKYISDAINSVIKQSYPNIEIIIVVDGATDDTLEIANSFKEKNVRVFYQENKGQDAAFNFGYSFSSGKYIKFMDADDLISTEHIEIQLNILNGSEDFIAYSEWALFYKDDANTAYFQNRIYYKDMTPVDFLTSDATGPMLQCGTMLIPRQLIEKSGLWDTRLVLFNDTEFYTRLLLNSNGIKFCKGAKLYYRSGHTSNLTNQRSIKYYESTLLGARLVWSHLKNHENSKRTRILVANLLQMRLFDMYPNYKELEKKYQKEIKDLGGTNLKYKSGKIFNSIRYIFGWKTAVWTKKAIYKLGYKPTLHIPR